MNYLRNIIIVTIILLPTASQAAVPFVGEPKTMAQLATCEIVVSKWSKKTYTKAKDAKTISKMSPKWAICKALRAPTKAPEPKTKESMQLELEALNMALYGNPFGPVQPEPAIAPIKQPTPAVPPVAPIVRTPKPTVTPVETISEPARTTINVMQWEENVWPHDMDKMTPHLFIQATWETNELGSLLCKSPNTRDYTDGMYLARNTLKSGHVTIISMRGWSNYDQSDCSVTVGTDSVHKTYTYHDGGEYNGNPIIRN